MQPAFSASDDMSADELNAQARTLVLQQRFDEAEQLLTASLHKDKTADAIRLMGNIAYMRGDMLEAIDYFNAALELDPHDHASMATLAEVYFAMGDVNCAGYSIMAMAEQPDEIRYKQRFIEFSAKMEFGQYSPLIENALVDCLKTPGLDCSKLQGLWYNTFALSPDYKSIYKTFRTRDPVTKQKASGLQRLLGTCMGKEQQDYVVFDAGNFRKHKSLSPLLSPFFILGLRHLLIRSLAFEEFVTALRARLLNEPQNPELLPLAAAVAAYAFRTGYILTVTSDEQKKVEELRPRLEAGLPDGKEWLTCIYACYVPLYRLRNAVHVAEAFAGMPDMLELVRSQIFMHLTLEEIGETLREYTPIERGVSAKVPDAFPSPLWVAPARTAVDETAAPLRKEGAQILIAGCGTGLEAAQAAIAFPEGKITVVDLNRAALAYGALRAKELKLYNIDFGQADILKLGSLNRRFDGIFCQEALNHLEDPVHGWKALAGVLNPGGIMRMSLYSALGRRNIAKAQEIIRQKGYSATPEGMKTFRQGSPALLPYEIFHEIARAEDYYQLSMYRDMLFHVQEHRFDLLKIKEIMAGLGLVFLKMNVPPQVMAQFRNAYPADPEGRELENWHDFERRNPDTFTAMYQFWCLKK